MNNLIAFKKSRFKKTVRLLKHIYLNNVDVLLLIYSNTVFGAIKNLIISPMTIICNNIYLTYHKVVNINIILK
jgi:hypothetical protein